MQRLILLCLLNWLFFQHVQAQGVLISPSSGGQADNSAILELEDSTRGFLLPRLSTIQRNGILNPAVGLQVYNTTSQCLEIYLNSGWQKVVCNCPTPPSAQFTIAPFPLSVNNSSTFQANSPGLQYSWTFPNGSPSTSSASNPAVSWSSPDTIQVSLTVTDNAGCSAQKDSVLIVSSCVSGGSQTFTTCGKTGASGPSQAQCNASYGTGVVSVVGNGFQDWQVPVGVCSITIEAWGAESGKNFPNNRTTGLGAYAKGTFQVIGGTALRIFVGQQGGNGVSNPFGAGAGGGASGVFISGQAQPLIVAGGGGGPGGQQGTFHNGDHGRTTANGGQANPGGPSSGGTNGNGGAGGIGHQHCGAAGGGWLSSGTGTVSEATNGQGITLGALGGSPGPYGGFGGFGGGGGSNIAGGGGGGYSGGAGGDQMSGWIEYGGGGGGSYNSGTNTTMQSGVRSGHGQVLIAW